MGDFDTLLGALIVGSWINTFLFMLELALAYVYFSNFRDRWPFQGLVILALLVDTASTANVCIWVYANTITHWGDTGILEYQYWPVAMYLLTLGLSGFFTHVFLIYRYFMLCRNKWITGISALLALTSLGSCTTAVVFSRMDGAHMTMRNMSRIPITLWMSATTVTDIVIAASLVYQLSQVKTEVKETNGLIYHLAKVAISTGSATAALAVISIATYLVDVYSNVPVAVAMGLGRMYTITILYNLLLRHSHRKPGSNFYSDPFSLAYHGGGGQPGSALEFTTFQCATRGQVGSSDGSQLNSGTASEGERSKGGFRLGLEGSVDAGDVERRGVTESLK
ncbi:hypothetical protein BDV98DRAFT_604310 [Pterulicium gracile]|uniref:DUF6534 domain-containing protein n=1 Tax=Pterulicium gracile TaxID=1884261 RepID=A0A5C3QMY1_9AGAR|nr:hypothetical protein BDV98DRAFT_604310 [Pterula gracilis]